MTLDSRSTNRAMISVIEKARGRQANRRPVGLLSLLLLGVFFLALMVGLMFGAQMYRSAVRAHERANQLHLQSGLVTNLIRYNDVADAVRVGEGPEGRALVLERTLGTGTYETRIYQYQQQIVQEFAKAGRPYDPRGATPLLSTTTFDFQIDGSLVTITCDQGSFAVALRSEATEPGRPSTPVTSEGPAQDTVTIIDEGGM